MDSSILYRDCSEIIEDTMLGNQIDPSTASSSVTLVGCAFTDSEVEKLLRDAASGEAGVAGVDVVQDFLQKYPGKVDAVREFLKKYPDRLDARVFREKHSCSETFLQVAAQKGYRELCILLLDAGASLHAVSKKGPTPLHYAAVGNQPEILDLLLSRGADVNAVNNGLGYQNSALHLAVNHVQCVRVLLRYHCDVNLQNSNGNTALHEAIGKDALDVIDALCACERIDFTLRNKQGFNILHHAAIKGNAHATEKLVPRARQLVDVKTVKRRGGLTALHLAALKGRRKVAAILLSQNGGRAKVDLRNNRRQTPLHLATSRGHWPLVELLVHHNADVGSTDKYGNTVLHIAIAESRHQQTAVSTLESSRDSPLIYAIWQNLARKGAKTELALACFLVSVDRSCKLLEQVRNNKGKTPLDFLEEDPQAALLAELLRSYKYRSHSIQLEIENNPSTGCVQSPMYRIDNIAQSEGLRGGKENIVGFGDAAECRDCSEIIADMQENRSDPSSSVTLAGCAFTDSKVEKLFRDAARSKAGVDALQEFLKKYPGKMDAVRAFFKKYPDRVDACAFRGGGKTFLQVAVQKGYRELCTLLLDAGASLRADCKDGTSPLHYAAFGNQPEILDLLLSRGADVNAVNNRRCSALHVAVNKQHVHCVRVLLRHHCDVNLQDSYGDTALHQAINWMDKLDVIDALCACERIDFTLRNKRGFNVLHLAALKGNAHATKWLVARARKLVNVKKEDRFTALHLAALNGRREVAAILLSQVGGRAKVDLRNNRQQTPLHLATSRGHWSLVELLVHHNADVGSKDTDGNTVLHVAIVESQNQQTAVPTPESSRHSPLIYAIWQNLAKQGAKTELAVACFLVSMDRSCELLEQVRNNMDKTPLDLLEGNPQVARLTELLRSYKYRSHSTQLKTINNRSTGYIEPYRELKELFRDADRMKAGVDAVQDFLKKYPYMVYPVREFLKKFPNMVDTCAFGGDWKSTCTFLHVAAHRGYHELCTYLLDAGASLCAVDEDGDTPLHYAAFGNQPEILGLLLSRGADVNAVNNRRCSALHVTVNKQHVQCVRVLLRYHCDVNLQDSYGNTALHHAARKGTLDVIDALCACERRVIDFTLRNKWGSTILHRVALSGNAHATERLIARARQLVDVKEVDGFAALHLAALNGHREVAVILLSQNGGRAKVDLRNNRRQTPLHLATSRGHWPLVELLVHHNADVGSTDEDGDTVLHIAIAKSRNQHTAGPTPESSRDSPLVYTIWQNLAKQGAKTELAVACFLVSMDRSCKLLEQVRNNKDKTPLDLLEGNPQVARLTELLRSYKYRSHSRQLKTINNRSTGYIEPPTYRELKELFRDADRMKTGVDAVQDFLKKYPDMVYPVREFLKKFPNMVDACAFGGDWKSTCTFLHVAAHKGYHELCTYLLDAGAFLCAVDEDGDTPLHYAAFGNQPEILNLLLSRGADVNAVNNRRCSALHVAVNKQHMQCVRVLLRYHCDVNNS